MGAFAALGGLIWVIFLIVGFIYVICPLLYLFSFGTLKDQNRQLLELKKKDLKFQEQELKLQQELLAQTTLAAFEMQNQNQLTRQLLRAYGHEPEV